jgi:hypothetical protein
VLCVRGSDGQRNGNVNKKKVMAAVDAFQQNI